MRKRTFLPTLLRPRGLVLLGMVGLVGLLGLRGGVAAQGTKGLTAETVRDLQAKYKTERAAAESGGLTKKFSPEWYQQADGLAKRAEEALAGGRLVEARDDYQKARALLPALPGDLPPN